ncbi:hypothetical protein R3P38DRAFT_3218044 [Favolaschia claudopus]|uniref:Uncharacterized protein n=1 Tax=Favolaschia claudopus TaxID=2862362 RepID=A0AAW0A3U4_9AGAR
MAQTRAKTGRKVAALETLADAAAQVSAASEYTVNSSWSPPGDVKTAPSSPGSRQDSDIDELDDQSMTSSPSSRHLTTKTILSRLTATRAKAKENKEEEKPGRLTIKLPAAALQSVSNGAIARKQDKGKKVAARSSTP